MPIKPRPKNNQMVPCPLCGQGVSGIGHRKPGGRALCLSCHQYFTIPGKVVKKKPKAETEAQIQADIIEAVKEAGWMVVRLNSARGIGQSGARLSNYFVYGITQMPMDERFSSSSGMPDVLAFKGRGSRIEALMLEIKTATGRLEKNQEKFQNFARTIYGINCHVVRSVEEVKEIINNAENKNKSAKRPKPQGAKSSNDQ